MTAVWPWLSSGLGILVLLKLGLAVHWFGRAKRCGLVSTGASWKYLVIWIWGTEFLLLLALSVPVSGAAAYALGLLAFLALPLARVNLALLAFAKSRVQ